MSESTQAASPVEVRAESEPVPPPEPQLPRQPHPLLDRTVVLFPIFAAISLVLLIAAFMTVHDRPSELLTKSSGATRSHLELMHWLQDGYFHDCGLLIPSPLDTMSIYRSSTGGYLISGFVVQKIYSAFSGHYSWRLNAWHNQVVSLLLSALLGLLAYRLARRMGLDARLALPAGVSVTSIIFTFPSNLFLYWEMTSQAYALLTAVVFLLIEERCTDGERTWKHSLAQAVAIFLTTYFEMIFGLACVCALAILRYALEHRPGAWRRFVLVAVVPCAAAFAMYRVQISVAAARFPKAEIIGSELMFRTGFDGESLYYGDHLDIAWRRDVARGNWKANREYLFVWKWVFILGIVSSLGVLAAYVAGRAPRIAVESLFMLAGGWVLYGAVFSQAFVIHPYLYDVLLFAPFVVAVFALAPALLESMTRRSGAIVMIVLFCACWYSMFQLRRYALWYPMPGAKVGTPPAAVSR